MNKFAEARNLTPEVVFFSNQFARDRGTGIARYAHGLLNGFAQLADRPNVTPVATWSNRDPEDLDMLKAKTGLRILPTGRWLSPLLWMTIEYPTIEGLLDFRFDLIHVSDLGYLIATSKPYVVTIHDIGSLTHPEFFNNNSAWIVKKSLDQAVKKAAGLLCVSQATADSVRDYIQRQYSADVSFRTFVAHEGISEKFYPPPQFLPQTFIDGFDFLRNPFILAVGKISPRKNIEIAFKAVKRLQSSIPHHLVVVGGDGWDFQGVKNLVGSLGLSDRVHFLGYVSDEQLHVLYAKAALFIYPSLFEGFGLPVLEAMAAGCPVITSNISSLPEVAGDAALLVNPRDLDEVTSAIEAVCKNPAIAEELRRKGIHRASRFSWKKCAEETLQVYETLID